MINITFKIRSPFGERFDNLFDTSGGTPFKNKYWEFQIMKTSDVVAFDFSVTQRRDHAGIYFEVGLFGYNAAFNFYDCRHWNHETNDWETYN